MSCTLCIARKRLAALFNAGAFAAVWDNIRGQRNTSPPAEELVSSWIPVSWPFRYGAFRGRAQQSPPRTQQLVAHNHSILLKRMASIRLGALSRELIALLSAAPSTTFWLGIVVAFSRDGFCSAWRRRGEARTTTRSSSNGASFLGSERSQRWRTSPTAFCESKALLEDRSATHP